jgi:hypothetical protein
MTKLLPLGHEYQPKFRNGKVLTTQSPIVVAHYRSDARLATIHITPTPTKTVGSERSNSKVWLEGARVMREDVH